MNSTTKQDIRALSTGELEEFFISHNEKPFRAKQVNEWLWKKSCIAFDEMSNLSKSLRDLLSLHFQILPATNAKEQISSDGTVKSAFSLHDGKIVEGVLIPTPKRMTACISSQVGCSLTCSFCATGRLKRLRNLTAAEIYDQVVMIKKQADSHYQKPLTNIVYMGMGEPLLNYKNVLESTEKITSQNGLGMSPKRITVSTAGIAKMINRLGDDGVLFNLALSLHAANDKKRDKIMPINEQNNLSALSDALQYFYQKTKSRITFEYIIFNGFNDQIIDAKELVSFCRKVPSKVNIIEYNPIDDSDFRQANPENTGAFASHLEKNKITVKIRRSRGKDIDAACGQLANKSIVSA